MSHRDPASASAFEPRRFAYIVLAFLPLSVWSCDLQDTTNVGPSAAGSGGSGGSAAGSGGSGGVPTAGSGGSGGATGGSSGSAGAGATGGSSGSAGAGGMGGSSGTSGDPDAGADAAVPDSGGGSGSTFNCTSGDSACALCEVWTQLADCQPTSTCPEEQRTNLAGLGCDPQYTAYLDCYATEPVTSSTCAPTPSTRLANPDLGGTGTENNCQAQECALYGCLLNQSLTGCP